MPIEISEESANYLINKGYSVAYIKYLFGYAFGIRFKYDPILVEKIHEIPSVRWIKSERLYMFHFFDFNEIIEFCANFGLEMKFELGLAAKIKEIKGKLKFISVDCKTEKKIDIEGIKKQLREYQIIGAQFMYFAKKCINADAPGTGKTLQSIAAITLNKNGNNGHKTIAVVPNSVKWNWLREIEESSNLKAIVLDSNWRIREKQYQEDNGQSDVYIMSYDSFLRDYEIFYTFFKPNILIIDEATRLANKNNKITMALVGGKKIKKPFLAKADSIHSIYLLTGTPIVNKLEDLFPLIKALDPTMFNIIGFRKKFVRYKEIKKINPNTGKEIVFPIIFGYKNLDEIKKRLAPYMIRRTKDDVLKELPPVTFKTIEIELSKEERDMYEKLKEEYIKNFKAISLISNGPTPEMLNWFMKAQLICNSLELVQDSNSTKSTKLEELKSIIENIIEENKIIIFTKFKKMLDIINRELSKYKPLLLYGDMPDKKRQENIDIFRNDPERKIFISTLAAGGVGVNLTVGDMSNITLILYDRWYSAAMNNQAISRAFRIGQNKPIEVIIMRAKDTIEERIEQLWIDKEILSSDIIDDDEVFKRMTAEQMLKLI